MKEQLALFLNRWLQKAGMTQTEAAQLIGIKQGQLSSYLQGNKMPRLEVLLKISQLTGISVNDMMKPESNEEMEKVVSDIKIKADNGGVVNIAGRDIYQNTVVKRKNFYTPKPGDLTPEHAETVKRWVGEIVELEKVGRQKPKSYGAVYLALNRRFKVTYYREIPEAKFKEVEFYLTRWMGRLKRPLKRKDPDQYRQNLYKYIHSAKKQVGWTAEDLKDYLFGKYGVESLTELTTQQLEQVRNTITYRKKKNG